MLLIQKYDVYLTCPTLTTSSSNVPSTHTTIELVNICKTTTRKPLPRKRQNLWSIQDASKSIELLIYPVYFFFVFFLVHDYRLILLLVLQRNDDEHHNATKWIECSVRNERIMLVFWQRNIFVVIFISFLANIQEKSNSQNQENALKTECCFECKGFIF